MGFDRQLPETQNSSFVEFITAKPLSGCGWPLDKVAALIKDNPGVLTLWREATTRPVGTNQYAEGSHNVTTLKAQRGNSVAYTLTRLKREAPELHQAVCRGEMSANAAAIQAGFRKRLTPLEQLQRLLPKLSAAHKRAIMPEFVATLSAAERRELERLLRGIEA
jgi:hypothetical protein